jgi:cysteate synthase
MNDRRFGIKKMKLMVSQNEPFIPIKEAWEVRSRSLLPMDDQEARIKAGRIDAKVLSNRHPPYSIQGGLFDALTDTGGEVLSATNEEAKNAGKLFEETEGIDIDVAAAVAVASLIKAVKSEKIDQNAVVMLNITGGGIRRFKQEHTLHYAKAEYIFPIDPDPEMVQKKVIELFRY